MSRWPRLNRHGAAAMKKYRGDSDSIRSESLRKKSVSSSLGQVIDFGTYRKQPTLDSEKLRSKVIARASHLKKSR